VQLAVDVQERAGVQNMNDGGLRVDKLALLGPDADDGVQYLMYS
jgi:hypothetical protein